MLVLSRKTGEVINIGTDISITVVGIDRGIVRLGVEAPKDVAVHRKEIYEKIKELNRQAAASNVNEVKVALQKAGMLKISQTNNEVSEKEN